jgi:ElaA protein
MKWILKKFSDLTTDELHDVLQLRINVFVVEQDCPYNEVDGKDKIAHHLLGFNYKNEIIAYTRIFKPGDYYKQAAFGRVVVHNEYRNQKIGYDLVNKTILEMKKLFGNVDIKIGGQTYLKKFYKSFGFKQIGEGYIEDGIPHIFMVLETDQ